MNTKILHLAIIASGCVAAAPAYAVPAVMRPLIRAEVVQHHFKLIAERHKHNEYSGVATQTTADIKSSPNFEVAPDFKDRAVLTTEDTSDATRSSIPAAAPEIDPSMAAGALTLLAGGLAAWGGRRGKRA